MKKPGILKILGLVVAIFGGWCLHDYWAQLPVVENEGLSFGWWPGQIWLNVLVWLALGYYWWKIKTSWGVGLMLTGGGINLIDRWKLALVRDYWPFVGGRVYNNMADYLIGIGLFVFILELWRKK